MPWCWTARWFDDKPMPWEALLVIDNAAPQLRWQRNRLHKEDLDALVRRKASALQGHLLVGGGKVRPLKPSPALERRAFIVHESGAFAIVESSAPAELAQFAADLVALGAHTAMNLDMGRWSEGWYRDPKQRKARLFGQGLSRDGQTNQLDSTVGPMKIGVMGAGAVGCFVGGRLLARGANVVLVGRDRLRQELLETGLTLSELSRPEAIEVAPRDLVFETEPEALRDRDVVLVAVKSGQTAAVGRQLANVLPEGVVVVSLQNGLGNADVLREALPRQLVLAGIVGFNVVWKERGSFRRATSGPLVIEAPRAPDARVDELARVARGRGLRDGARS